MIVGDTYLKTKKGQEDMLNHPYNFMVLDIEHLSFKKDQEIFEKSILLMNLANSFKLVNEFYKGFAIEEVSYIEDTLTIVECVFKNQPHNNLKDFFRFAKTVEQMGKAIQSLAPNLSEHMYLETEVIMVLTGFGWEKQAELKTLNKDVYGHCHDTFWGLYYDTVEGKRTVESFKKEGLHLLETALKQAIETEKGEETEEQIAKEFGEF